MNSRSSSFPRRRLAAAAVCGVLLVSDLSAGTAPPTLQSAQEALARGDVAKAAEIYEILVAGGESLEAELGIVRTALQGGELRKAVAHANEFAAEHLDSTEAAAQLAFILDRSGRTEQALASLQQLELQRPRDWVAFAAHAEILIDRLDPRQALSIIETALKAQQPAQPAELLRLAARARGLLNTRTAADEDRGGSLQKDRPWQVTWIAAATQRLPVATREMAAAGNGVVIDAGRSVLTDAMLFKGTGGKAWVRNGIGQVRAASVEPAGESGTLVRLKLDEPFPGMASTQVVAPEGSRFCFVLAFGAPGSLDPAFPAITPGRVMRADTGIGGLMQITATLGAGHNGAAVFDPRGRLLGMAIAAGDREIEGKEEVRKLLGNGNFAFRVDRVLSGDKVPAAAGPQPPMPSVEELYERLVPTIVQVIALK